MSTSYTLQVTTVWPGAIGGAIFKGNIIGGRSRITCKASYKVLDRPPSHGEFWIVTGSLSNHSEYGQQLQVSKCQLTHLPSDIYVSSLLTRHPVFRGFHFGKSKVNKLMTAIGPESLIDLLNGGKSNQLADIISPVIAERVVTAWANLKNEIDTINFLREHNIDVALSRKIIKLCKANTVERLKTNPYALVCFGGITKHLWRTIDSIATKFKIHSNDERRLVGAVEHILYDRLRQGHTAIERNELVLATGKLLKDTSIAEPAIAAAMRHKAACVQMLEGLELVQPIGPAYIEYSIEKIIARLIGGPMQQSRLEASNAHLQFMITRYSNEFTREQGFSLTDQQLQAVKVGLANRCAVINGFGGTGKTTVLRTITEIATHLNRTVYLMALSGKAKERISQATSHEAMTIHSFIKAATEGNDRIDIHGDPLLIIDEASMVDIALFNKLLMLFDTLPFSLLTVGDTAQLSPIGFGIVWHRMAISRRIPSQHLTQVHRQAQNSPIHHAAMKIRQGKNHNIPIWNGEESGIFLVETPTDQLLQTLTSIKKSLTSAQVLTAHMSDRMADNANSVNVHLQEKLNSQSPQMQSMKLGAIQIRTGDPVIVTDNCYDLNLFNGTTGQLKSITVNHLGQLCCSFLFDSHEEIIELTAEQMFDVNLQLAYAISIHKSQGSEYDTAIICCSTRSPLIERSLIYTAITRSKKLCLIVGTQDRYNAAIMAPARADTLCVGIDL